MSALPDWLTSAGAAALAWLAGETGRALAAGAAGGVARWLSQEKRHLRDGILAVFTGALSALYLSPVILAILTALGWHLGDSAAADRSVGFLAGLSGMSIAKVVLAAVETWASRASRGGDDGAA